MAESVLKPLGDPGKGIHSARCRCVHNCNGLKDDLWCCHWFLLYWVPTREMLPTDVLGVLRGLIGTTEFDYFVKPSSTGALRMLVYVEDFTVLNGEQFDLRPGVNDGDFVRRESRFWRLTCCFEALAADWNYWRSRLTETDGPPNFSRFRQESGTLVDDLTRRILEWRGRSVP